MTIPEHLDSFFQAHSVPEGATLLVAVSGGADSLALLSGLAELRGRRGFHVRAGHLHHGMRAEADADVAMLADLCTRLDVPLEIRRTDVPALAEQRKVSLEVAGREARYAFLYEAAAATGAYGVCTGHTRDDQAETVLLRILAGTGLEGLAGIAPARHAHPPESTSPVWLLRPLLPVRRAETVAFCAERGLTPVSDPYNADPRYPRNRIRHELLPLLERDYNPAVKDALARLADLAREENATLEALAEGVAPIERTGDAVCVSRAAMAALEPALRRRAARRLLRAAGGHAKGLRFSNVERLLSAAENGAGRMNLQGGLTVEVRGDAVCVVPTPPVPERRG